MFMIRRTSPCYIRQVQSAISPNKSQNISVKAEAWRAASSEPHQTAGEQRLQHPAPGGAEPGRIAAGWQGLGASSLPLSTGPLTLSTRLNLSEPRHSNFWKTDVFRA